MRIHEELILIKLDLSRRHPRIALHSRKSTLRIILMKLSVIIEMLGLKSFIINKRKLENTNNTTHCHKEYRQVEVERHARVSKDIKDRH